ncbi:MAG TPA: efflux RND transporter periplasmic adaptor subunit [Thermoanaerobaculia bacterium]|nr:efflux RND transporter periplasmic adaptor subunit [Thermoanaerobaculia bacterium]
MSRKVFITLLITIAVGFAIFLFARHAQGNADDGAKLVTVKRGTIVDKALATGKIVPKQEIQVKSQISGTVKHVYVEVGDKIKAGDPLLSVSPDPTPLQLTEAERNRQMAQVTYAKAKTDLDRAQELQRNGIEARDVFDQTKKAYDQAQIQLELAKERLDLLKVGQIKKTAHAAGVDSVIRASTRGTVLERLVNPGDPVVPLTTYQAGTALMTLADMNQLIFKGTVDEIDVGKLHVGLPVKIQLGALPDAGVTGTLTLIAPKAQEKDGATFFDVEAKIDNPDAVTLRAGYSANADIIIKKKPDVLLLPERVVSFEGEKAFVQLPPKERGDEPMKQEIQVGLSDGMNVEVTSGLKAGQKVVEPPPKKIEGVV